MVKSYFKGLALDVPEGVYTPREDTELLFDSLDIKKTDNVLEIGSGSGAVSLTAAKTALRVTGVDIDPLAVACATKNAQTNGIENVKFAESDMFGSVRGTYDLVLFNSPYLPTNDPWEGEARTWSGGPSGRTQVERFVKGVREHLKTNGRIFILISSLTGLDEVKKLFEKEGFLVTVAAERNISWEKLYVLKARLNRQNKGKKKKNNVLALLLVPELGVLREVRDDVLQAQSERYSQS